MTERIETVPAALDGERIDRVVAMVTGLSRTEVTALIEAGAVAVDGNTVPRGKDRLREGQELRVIEPEHRSTRPAPDGHVEVPVVFVDDDVIVVDKPADLVVHPGAGHPDGTLVNGLLALYPEIADVGQPDRPGIVHRLDRGTSGLLAVARSEAAYESLVSQLQERSVLRRYRTVVWGHPESVNGLIDAPIGRSPRHPTRMAVVADGKEARTRYEVERTFDLPAPSAELTCRLETGRTHQIRVHLSAIGHPVVGDDRYQGVRQSLDCPRPFLHAEHLGFLHPVTEEQMAFDSALPDDLTAVLARLA
ncbi:MAG: RluA family pseudouridine synthase [Acidimicrobiales bacterium]|nr:RluA family pseudouridine synthase [Acidimicrobiales bacterium]